MKITMKKSILLNEDEKNRILNLHETAKNLYENKKPVSSIKEDNSKKENMKKVIKLTESDLEKIVRRVIEEQYMGVAFAGGEPNGLKIKKVEATEQAPVQPGVTGGAPVDKKQIYNSDIAKINQFLPVDTTKFKPIFALIKSGSSDKQAFDQYQDVIKQIQDVILPKINPQGAKERVTSNSERYTSLTGIGSVAQNYKAALNLTLQDILNVKMGLQYLAQVKAGLDFPKPAWIKSQNEMEMLKKIGNQIGIA